jgi:surface polysaccharide O-acyltransferase-like enzyme
MRKYELDWLRVIVFALLIIYHSGMFFVPWEWHIKNNELSDSFIIPMRFVSQWRLSLLFLISGMGTAFAGRKRGVREFVFERFRRIFIPLVCGIFITVIPQVWIERVSTGEYEGSFLSFLAGPAFSGIYPDGNFSWHHLWFLPYLLFFSLIIAPFNYKWELNKRGSIIALSIAFILLFLSNFCLRLAYPSTHAFWGDWYNLSTYFIFFSCGFIIIKSGNAIWNVIKEFRLLFLITASLSFYLMEFTEITRNLNIGRSLLLTINTSLWIVTLLGYAIKYLSKSGKYLNYANRAVYPFYIIHQTVTVFLGYIIMNLSWPVLNKFIFMVVFTFLITFILYEFIVRRIKLLHPIFGLK